MRLNSVPRFVKKISGHSANCFAFLQENYLILWTLTFEKWRWAGSDFWLDHHYTVIQCVLKGTLRIKEFLKSFTNVSSPSDASPRSDFAPLTTSFLLALWKPKYTCEVISPLLGVWFHLYLVCKNWNVQSIISGEAPPFYVFITDITTAF